MENLSLEPYSQHTENSVLLFSHFPLYSGLTNQEQNGIIITHLLENIKNAHHIFIHL